jgi:hypothetical protein
VQAPARRVPARLGYSIVILIFAALLAGGSWFSWKTYHRLDDQLAGARLEVAQAQSTLAGQQELIQQARATVSAQETAMALDARRILGPMSGELVHDWDAYLEAFPLILSFKDFELSVRFTTPYDGNVDTWDFGIIFRNIGGSGSYRLAVFSTGTWKLTYGAWPQALASGTLEDLNVGADMQNQLRLRVVGDQATFYLNDLLVSELDVSAHPDSGGISVAIGIWQGNEQAGALTRFEDLTLWTAP